jgi:TMEM175 potassium channel family protein
MTPKSRSIRRRPFAHVGQEHSVAGAMGHIESERPAAGTLERLIFLSDGVFAIAMTLLVVELTPPDLASGTANLVQGLSALGPSYFSFTISFLVIASYWRAHQRMFSHVLRADDRLVWLNVLLLLCIAFEPFPTSVMGRYGNQSVAVTLYAATLAVTGVILLLLWLYATSGRRLVSADIDPRLVAHQMWRAATVPIVFLVSIAIAQVNPSAAEYSWISIAFLLFVLGWVFRDAH